MERRKYDSFYKEGQRLAEEFANANLENVVWATRDQDKFEHWDMKGNLVGDTRSFKFDVKGLKKFNRRDPDYQDKMMLVEYQNITGGPGWVKGQSDWIPQKRLIYPWMVVRREPLWNYLESKLEERNYAPTTRQWFEPKEPYAVYDRKFFGNDDRFVWVPYEDIEKLEHIKLET